MPGWGVTPELVALIPSGYTPLTWATMGSDKMQLRAKRRSDAALVARAPLFTRRAEFRRLWIVRWAEASADCHAGLSPERTWPDISRKASASAIRLSQLQRP